MKQKGFETAMWECGAMETTDGCVILISVLFVKLEHCWSDKSLWKDYNKGEVISILGS